MNVFNKKQFTPFVLLLTIGSAFGQSNSSFIEPAADDAQYERILEYYSYDEGHYLDPAKYNEEILEWLKNKL